LIPGVTILDRFRDGPFWQQDFLLNVLEQSFPKKAEIRDAPDLESLVNRGLARRIKAKS